MNGLLIKGVGGLYTVLADGKEYACRARGHFRHDETTPTVGDRVSFSGDGKNGMVIDGIEERRNLLIRPPLANLDLLFVVVAAKSPDPNLLNVDKLLAVAEKNAIEPALIVTKSDLDRESAEEIASVYRLAGIDTHIRRAEAPEETRSFVLSRTEGKISAFAGVSGVGKSTLMNLVFPSLSVETGCVSEHTERGRHTTRHVELFSLSDLTEGRSTGFLADTPGFSMLDFLRFDFLSKEELPESFREFADYLPLCRYSQCTHTGDEGCAVGKAVGEGKIARSRYENYKLLFEELKTKPTWKK